MSSDITTYVTVMDDERKRLPITGPITISVIVSTCAFGGVLFGIFIHSLLPRDYLDSDSKEAVRLRMALVGTTVAVALGLLIASAKGFYDSQNSEVTQLAADVVLLDKILYHYEPETEEIRDLLRSSVVHMVTVTWGRNSSTRSVSRSPQQVKLLLPESGSSPLRTTVNDSYSRKQQARRLN